MLTFAIPQSEPSELKNNSDSLTSLVKIELLKPCFTEFCSAIAALKSVNGITYNIGAKVSSFISSICSSTSTRAGVTKNPSALSSLSPPVTFNPMALHESSFSCI